MGQVINRIWNVATREVLLPIGDHVFGQQMMRRLRFIEQAQWWTRDRIHEHRNRLLQELVSTAAAEVPFYRDLMKSAGVEPRDIRAPEDLQRLPVVTKDMLRPAYPHAITRQTAHRTFEVSSSGSTGENFRVRSDTQTVGWHRATHMLALHWAGWRIGERHMQTGMNLQRTSDRRLKDMLLRCYYVSAFDLSNEALDRALDVLDRNRIDHLWGYPGSLYYLARRALERGWNRNLRSVVTWGDMLYPQYRETIERAFGKRVTDTYGCGEGMHIAAQCGVGNHYHIHELDVVVEFLDGDGRPVADGTPGNVVLTRLHPGPMPLIRYQVGDLAIPAAGACSCGRGSALMASIYGRDTDVIITPSGNRLIVHFFTGIIEYFHDIAQFQVVQDEPDAIILRVVPGPGYTADTARRVVEELKVRGADIDIKIELVDRIPVAPSGKRRFIISNYARSINRIAIER